ncbi:MAG: hypothetical protein PF518_03850 [Spirochaetaceae bacterium]|jgi:hypothetical protein|nr:hypothetical protein [Spirochaetaceae bacterium]
MKIVDLQPQYEGTYFKCLEDWSSDMEEAGDHKSCWYHKFKDRGLRVKLALDEKGIPAGNIAFERMKNACGDYGDKVSFEAIDTSEREVFLQWGICDGIYLNGKEIGFGPPLTYKKIHKILTKNIKRIS